MQGPKVIVGGGCGTGRRLNNPDLMQLETNPATQLQVQGANSKNRTISKVKSHTMSIKVQRVTPVTPVHFRTDVIRLRRDITYDCCWQR